MQVLLKLFIPVDGMGHSFQPPNPCNSDLELSCLSIFSCFQA